MLILNRVRADMVRRGDMLDTDDVLDILAVNLLGIIPEDEAVLVSSNRGIPVALNGKSNVGQAYRDVAGRLQGEDVPFPEPNESWAWLSRLTQLVRRGD